ncbi:MAG: leucine-rich repeat protein [Oscillospiraceae bacterium]
MSVNKKMMRRIATLAFSLVLLFSFFAAPLASQTVLAADSSSSSSQQPGTDNTDGEVSEEKEEPAGDVEQAEEGEGDVIIPDSSSQISPQSSPVIAQAAPAVAAIATAEDDFVFNQATGYITGYQGDETDVVIPEIIDGVEVVGIDEDAFSPYNIDTSITSVEIPATITDIGDFAFYGCEDLTGITFLGAPPTLGWNAFLDVYDAVFYCHVDYEDEYEDLLDDYLGFSYGNGLSTFGTPTSPEEPEEPQVPENKDFTFVLSADKAGYAVEYYTGKGGDVVIPAQHEDKAVVGISGSAFSTFGSGKYPNLKAGNTNVTVLRAITSLTMPNTITYAEDWSMAGLLNMTNITLSSNIKTIGPYALQNCDALTTLAIPASATNIDNEAFVMCAKLENITVDKSNPNYSDIDGIFYNKAGTVLISYPNGRAATQYKVPEGTVEIAARAFKMKYTSTAAGKLEEVSYPKSLTKIGDGAFFQCSLRRITVYSNIEMGTNVYDGGKNITEVIVAEGVTEINKGLFYGLENCETVVLPSTLRKIGAYAFDRLGYNKPELSLTLPEGLEEIGEDAFVLANIVNLQIPSTVTTIGTRAFYLCKKLQTLSFAEGSRITTIGAYAFNHCTALKEVSLPNSVTTLEDGSFSYCYALQSINLPSSITTLKNTVFAGSGLVNIVLPASITSMGSAVFRDCLYLENATLPANLQTLGTCTFENDISLVQVDFPASMKITSLPIDTFF